MHSTNHKGAIAEAEIAAAAIRLGIPTLKPQVEHGRYDLVFDLGPRFLRVQCKWAPLKGAVVQVKLEGYRFTSRGHVRSTYSVEEIDAVAAYCGALDRCYLLPVSLVAGMRMVYLRLEPPRNAQRAALHWAADYQLPGAVAQWEERLSGTQEGTGSSPVSSTPSSGDRPRIAVGAHEFRNHFGWYMERAAAGDEILITRRGRSHARLLPPHQRTGPRDTTS